MQSQTRSGITTILAIIAVVVAGAFLLSQIRGDEDVESRVSDSSTSAVVELADSPLVLGNPEAPITIVEVTDYYCPFCARFHQDTFPRINSEYIQTGKAKMVIQNVSFIGGAKSEMANLGAYCANDQNQFEQYHNAMFENATALKSGAKTIGVIAQGAGLDKTQFDSCMAEEEYADQAIQASLQAQNAGINSTPTFLIGEQKISGAQPFSVFSAILNAQ